MKYNDMTNRFCNGFLFLGAMVPSEKDIELVPDFIRKYKDWYWLRNRSKRNNYDVKFVDKHGDVDDIGFYCYEDKYICLRPMLDIKFNENFHYIGEKFYFGKHCFKIISENRAFCLDDLGIHKFDEDTNVYMKSMMRRSLKKWYEKSLSKYIEENNFGKI